MELTKRALLATLLTLSPIAATADVALIVNPANSVSEISIDEAKRLYLGKTGNYPDGSTAEVIDQAAGESSRAVFYKKVVGKSESQAKAYWSKQIFTGKGTPPEEVNGDDAVKAKVASTPSAVGYIDAAAVDGSVKQVLLVQ